MWEIKGNHDTALHLTSQIKFGERKILSWKLDTIKLCHNFEKIILFVVWPLHWSDSSVVMFLVWLTIKPQFCSNHNASVAPPTVDQMSTKIHSPVVVFSDQITFYLNCNIDVHTNLDWVSAYLTGRSCPASCEGSSPLPYGVPHGSVLGLLLFSLYLLPLSEIMRNH